MAQGSRRSISLRWMRTRSLRAGSITPDAIHLSVDSEKSRSYEAFHAMHVERLGLKGLFFWKHTGWKDSSE